MSHPPPPKISFPNKRVSIQTEVASHPYKIGARRQTATTDLKAMLPGGNLPLVIYLLYPASIRRVQTDALIIAHGELDKVLEAAKQYFHRMNNPTHELAKRDSSENEWVIPEAILPKK